MTLVEEIMKMGEAATTFTCGHRGHQCQAVVVGEGDQLCCCSCKAPMLRRTYRIVRMHRDSNRRRIIKRGLTFGNAKASCRVTDRWIDGHEIE